MVKMNRTIGILMTVGVAAGAMVFAGGCADTPAQTNSSVRRDVTDIRPMEPAITAAYQPPVIDNSGLIPTAQQPVTTEAPTLNAAPPMMSTTPIVSKFASEKKHTVRRGETLFSIAKTSYGDGKAWKKIVSANPGLSPSKLKVGQVIAMP